LTYVVWAISPEGRAQSIGELVLNGSDKGHLTASTPMQAFALIVTAEPYYSVSKPSGVVVMENAVRPETVGQVEQVNATYELLPRTEYTYTMDTPAAQQPPAGPAMSMQEYEALLATYQAKNAIQIAIAAGADRYAPDRLRHAQEIFDQARQLPRKTQGEQVVASMREAAQIAEDARAISALRAEEEHDTQVKAQAMAQAAQAQIQAQNQAAQAAADQAAAAQSREEADRTMSQQVQPQPAPPPPPVAQAPAVPQTGGRDTRAALRQQLGNSGFQTLDTPRGLVVVIPDMLLEGSVNGVRGRLAVVASSISAYPNLRVEVDGNTDRGNSENANYRMSQQLAGQVRAMLLAQGVPPASIAAYGYGSTRRVGPNKQENDRVEVVISGAPIGEMPVWERTYSFK
jgi:flagellar motor protein MotB